MPIAIARAYQLSVDPKGKEDASSILNSVNLSYAKKELPDVAPSFTVLLTILLLFSWVELVHVGAPNSCARGTSNMSTRRGARPRRFQDHRQTRAAERDGGDADLRSFIVNSSISTLTSLDFLGFGLPPGSPSLGELLFEGTRQSLRALARRSPPSSSSRIMLSLLVFIGEAVRDAFDPRKTLRMSEPTCSTFAISPSPSARRARCRRRVVHAAARRDAGAGRASPAPASR